METHLPKAGFPVCVQYAQMLVVAILYLKEVLLWFIIKIFKQKVK